MKFLGSAVLTVLLAGACTRVQVVSDGPSGPAPDCVAACEPFSACRPDLPELAAQCLSSCANQRRDADDRRTLAALTCPQVEALAGYGPESTPEILAGAKPAAFDTLGRAPVTLAPAPSVRIEVLSIMVAAVLRETPARGAPDLTAAAWIERDGHVIGEGIADRAKDVFVLRLPGALEARLAAEETLHFRVVDHDGFGEELLGDFAVSKAELLQAIGRPGELTVDVRERSGGGVQFVTLRVTPL